VRTRSNTRGLAWLVTGLGLSLLVPLPGCGGGGASSTGPSGGGTSSGTGGGGGAGGEGGGKLNCNNDGKVDPTESCDDGNMIPGDGCENDCSFTCTKGTPVGDAKCDDKDPCNGAETCADDHTCTPGKPAADGTACGTGKVCKSGVCGDETCGDGFVSGAEECDDGNLTNGDGCDSCKFSCVSNDPARNCTGGDPCAGEFACNDATHTCKSAGPPPPDGQSCGPGAVCKGGVCSLTSCGDGVVDPAAGEQCEPPNTPGCDAMCKKVAIVVCGNGVRDAGEQCDDGNTKNLDGCDASCKFEQDQRANYLTMQFATDAYCTANALGAAISGTTAQGQLQTSLDNGVKDGSTTIAFKLLGLDDLTGTADPQVDLGVMNASPFTNNGMLAYDGTNDLDWWYTVDPLSIDASRNPLTKLPGSISAKTFTGGPGTVVLNLIFAGSPAPLKLSNVMVTGTIGATSAPLASMGGNPPGHLAGEHLDPALQSFATMGQKTANGAAKLCGNVSAASLAKVPIPAALVGGGLTACSQNYAATNSLLDVIIGGCTIFFIQQIKTTQPDTVDSAVPVAGAGGPYKLSANAQKVVSTCKDKSNATVDLATCLDAAAYSSFFKFATDRVIVK
jgi:cysteine-rich repeat protein